jgi:hypothetical protein
VAPQTSVSTAAIQHTPAAASEYRVHAARWAVGAGEWTDLCVPNDTVGEFWRPTVVGDMSDNGSAGIDDYSDLARLQQRTWAAAAPYLVAAVLAWIGAAFAEYQLNEMVAQSQPLEQLALRRTILQVLSQALLYGGLGLFTVGLLVAALRQHARWRRDCGRWLGDPLDMEDGVPDAE